MAQKFLLFTTSLMVSTQAFASEAAGHEAASLFSWDMAFKTANFIGLLVLLHFFAKKPITRMMSDAAAVQREDFLEQQRLVEAAEGRLEAFKTQMAEQEATLLKNQQHALASIEAQKARIIADAKQQAKSIELSTEQRIQQNLQKAKAELREFLAQEATDLAEGLIKAKLNKAEQSVLFDTYSNKLSQIS